MRLMRFLTSALLAVAVTAAPAWGQAVPVPPAAPGSTAAAALANRYVAEKKLPGVVMAWGGPNDVRFAASGKIGTDPADAAAGPDSLWRVYSMTKPVTGIAAMMLVEDGKLKLDQPISDFIPEFKSMRVLIDPAKSLESRPATTPITVRHLLTHTAGLGYTIITTGPLLEEYNRLGLVPAAVNALMEPSMRQTRPASLEEFAKRVAQAPLIAEPGTKWSYSISLDLLGRVIEVASGKPFDRFLQERIFTPLKMNSTWFTVPQSEVGRFATNYVLNAGNLVPFDPAATSVWLSPPSFPYGGAGLVSSARDYDRFLQMLLREGELDGVRVMKPATVRQAMSNLLPVGADTSALKAISPSGATFGFGAGGSVYLADLPGGPGKGTYGWAGAAGTLAWVDPVHKVHGVLMVNYFGQLPLSTEVIPAVYADIAR